MLGHVERHHQRACHASSRLLRVLTIGVVRATGALVSWDGAPIEESGERPAWQQLYVENVIRGGQNYVSG